MMNISMQTFGFQPITTQKELELLNNEEMVEGYLQGIKGHAVSFGLSKSYYHGYLNGLNDGGFRKQDDNQKKLIEELKWNGYLYQQAQVLKEFLIDIDNDPHFSDLYEEITDDILTVGMKKSLDELKIKIIKNTRVH